MIKILFFCVFFMSKLAQASPDWMRRISDDKKISEITILGTHNSIALHGGDYAACQTLSLKEQLEIGVRFLDIRCRAKNGDFHLVHGIADQKMLFTEAVEICQQFLDAHPSETILVSIMEQASRGLKAGEVGEIFKRVVEKNKSLWYLKNEIPSVREARGKLVVITRNKEIAGIPWRAFSIQDAFWISRQHTLDDKWQKIVHHFQNNKTQSINYASCTGILNPPNYTANIINKKLIHYLKANKADSSKVNGIVVVDFVTKKLAKQILP